MRVALAPPPSEACQAVGDPRVPQLLDAYRTLLLEHASLLARTTPTAELDALLADDAVLATLPRTVLADLRPVVAQACRLAERAGLRSPS